MLLLLVLSTVEALVQGLLALPMPSRPIVHPPPVPVARGSSHEVGAPPRVPIRELRCAPPIAAGPTLPPPAAPPATAAPAEAAMDAATATVAAACTVGAAAVSSAVSAALTGLLMLTKSSTSSPPKASLTCAHAAQGA